MFRYIKAFRIIMKGKDLEERYLDNFLIFALSGLIMLFISGCIKSILIYSIGLIAVVYGAYCLVRSLWIGEKDNIKEFLKQLKETANKLK